MQKLNLNENETLLGAEPASHVTKLLFLPQANVGKLYVTNMRIVFKPTQGSPSSAFEYKISDINSFSVGLASTIALKTNNGTVHKLTGMLNKKLISYLEAAGVKKSS